MIKDHVNLIRTIAEWIANYCKNNNIKCMVVDWDNSYNSALVIHLCVEARKYYNIPVIVCGKSWDDIKENFFQKKYGTLITFNENKYSYTHTLGGRDKYLDLINFTDSKKGIVVGIVNKTDGKLNRNYDKFGKGLADIFPIYNLYYSEVKMLVGKHFDELTFPNFYFDDNEFEDIEWATRSNEGGKYKGFITDKNPPNQHSSWPFLTMRQKKIVAELHQREKSTRHKSIDHKPFPLLRNTDLVL